MEKQMNNQNKWNNKELLYSLIFFVTAIVWFFFNPLAQIRDLIDSSPNAIDIKNRMFDSGISSIFYHVRDVMVVGLFLFLACSIYAGVQSLRKAPIDGKKIMFGLIPKSIPGFLAVLQVFISTTYIILHIDLFYFNFLVQHS